MLSRVSEPSRKCALLDLLFENREGFVGEMIVGSCLGLNINEAVEFKLWGRKRMKST